MSKVFIEETTLTAIGNAIREKTGKTELIAPLSMATEISSITTGGGGAEVPDSVFLMTGDCAEKLANDAWSYFMENEPYKSKFRSENITKATGMFRNCKTLKKVPFTLNFSQTARSITIQDLFNGCYELEEIPELGTPVISDNASGLFKYNHKIKTIPQSWVVNFKNDFLLTKSNANMVGIFMDCYSLRSVPAEFLTKLKSSDATASYYYATYYQLFQYNYCLDEAVGIPVYGNFTGGNAFSSTFAESHRLAEAIFETNEDGTPKIANWKGQTIDLNWVGWTLRADDILNVSDDFTTDDELNSSKGNVEEREAFVASHPNWFTTDIKCSRYTKQSAINTINSLPDTSAFLAANGGTNTIKFRSVMGALRQINGEYQEIGTLTPEQIAVATTKGWTVSFT